MINILLVEDQAMDARLTQMAFKKAGMEEALALATDGEHATEYIEGKGEYAVRTRFPLPNLILLDLHMPNRGGLEFLKWLRREPDFRELPVIVLSNSGFYSDVARAYSAGANSFLIKPMETEGFAAAIKLMKRFCENGEPLPSPPFEARPDARREAKYKF